VPYPAGSPKYNRGYRWSAMFLKNGQIELSFDLQSVGKGCNRTVEVMDNLIRWSKDYIPTSNKEVPIVHEETVNDTFVTFGRGKREPDAKPLSKNHAVN